MRYPIPEQQTPRVLLFTADRDIDSALLAEAVQLARQQDRGLTIYVTIPIDSLDRDVLDDVIPLQSLKDVVERRRRQKIELFVAPYRHLLREDIDITVHTGIEFIELIRTRMLGNYPTVLWVRNGDIQRLTDNDLTLDLTEQELVDVPVAGAT